MARDVSETKEQLPAEAELFKDIMGEGFKDAEASSFALPFLRVLQTNSPQCDPTQPAYNEEARAGMITDTVTGRLYKELPIVWVKTSAEVIEWKANRGGFVAVHNFEDPVWLARRTVEIEGRRRILHPDNDNLLQETHQQYVLYYDGEDWRPAMLPMASTQLKVARKWNSNVRDDMSHQRIFVWLATTRAESNDAGTWFSWSLARDEQHNELAENIIAFQGQLKSGAARVDRAAMQEDGLSSNAPQEMDNDIPF